MKQRVHRFMLVASLLGLPLVAGGCASTVPPRPVPQAEGQPELPGWYPEKPWSESDSKRVFLEGKVVFDTAKATLRPESERVLKQLLEYLQANPDISRIRLEGHTDDRASEEYNQGLSERRAIAVADWLVDHGLDNMRLLAVAFGKTRPLRTNATADGRQENRRTEFRIAELSGARFMGRDPANGGLVIEIQSKEDRERAKQVGKVPTYVEPPWQPQRDIIAPLPELPKAVGTEATSSIPESEGPASPPPPLAPKPPPRPRPRPLPRLPAREAKTDAAQQAGNARKRGVSGARRRGSMSAPNAQALGQGPRAPAPRARCSLLPPPGHKAREGKEWTEPGDQTSRITMEPMRRARGSLVGGADEALASVFVTPND